MADTASTASPSDRGSVARVEQALRDLGIEAAIRKFDASTRSAADAAAAIGCQVGQIAKSVIFRSATGNRPVLVIASGSNRIDEKKIAAALGERIGKADADFVRDQTGFAIGGVAPVGHAGPVKVFIDRDLQQYDVIWAAAGSPHAVFALTPAELERITGGQVIDAKP